MGAATITATSGGQSGMSSVTVSPSGSYATPDILNDASFETDWNGFTNGAPPNLPSPSTPDGDGFSVNRSQDVAYQGSWSAKVTFGPNPDNDHAVQMYYSIPGSLQTVFARMYFYVTALPNTSHHKWWRFERPGFGWAEGGCFLTSAIDGGAVTWFDPDVSNGGNNDIGTGTVTTNTWHSLEIEYDRSTSAQTYGARVRFWYEGNPIVGANSGAPNYTASGGSTAFWGDDNGNPANGPWLYNGTAGSNLPIAMMAWDDTYNIGGTNSGAFYYDWIAMSSQRIGP
jgi:hypothetical protein